MSKDTDTDLWIKLTEVATIVTSLNDKIVALTATLDERNKATNREVRLIREEIKADREATDERLVKLERARYAGWVVFTFLAGVGGFLSWVAGIWNNLGIE